MTPGISLTVPHIVTPDVPRKRKRLLAIAAEAEVLFDDKASESVFMSPSLVETVLGTFPPPSLCLGSSGAAAKEGVIGACYAQGETC